VEQLFFDAMHGSTVKGASNAEPPLRKDSDIAEIKKWEFAYESSFSASKNKFSPPPAINYISASFNASLQAQVRCAGICGTAAISSAFIASREFLIVSTTSVVVNLAPPRPAA